MTFLSTPSFHTFSSLRFSFVGAATNKLAATGTPRTVFLNDGGGQIDPETMAVLSLLNGAGPHLRKSAIGELSRKKRLKCNHDRLVDRLILEMKGGVEMNQTENR